MRKGRLHALGLLSEAHVECQTGLVVCENQCKNSVVNKECSAAFLAEEI
jgi:hypothetical protein